LVSGIAGASGLVALLVPNTGAEKIHGTVSRLARNAALNARLPCGIGTLYVGADLFHDALDKEVEDL
jgi:hypothetical protein